MNGKQVVVYKSGKTAPGMGGVMGHTASIAGGPILFESVVRQAGAIVAEDFNSFDDLFYIAGALHGKKIGGGAWARSAAPASRRSAWPTSSSRTASPWKWAHWKPAPSRAGRHPAGQEAQRPGRSQEPDRHQSRRRRRSPPADRRGLPADPNIDAVVVGLDPTAPSVRALQESKLRPGFDITDPKSTVHLMPPLVERNAKPIIGIVDGGSSTTP
jgi:hypothetical protein